MKILIIIALHFIAMHVFSQNSISNTKWKVRVEYPMSADLIFHFKIDTLSSTSEQLGSETLVYIVMKDTIQVRKITGSSPCDDVAEGYYRMELFDNGKKMILHLVRDNCAARSEFIISAKPLERIE